MEGIQIPEIYINSDMILSFDEEACNWNEASDNTNNSPKTLNTNAQNTSNKLNVNVNVNVNGNVNYSHSSSKCSFNTNNVSEEVSTTEYNSKSPEIFKGNTNKKISESIPFSREEIQKPIIIDCLLKDQNQFKTENQYVENSQSSNLLSFMEGNLSEKGNSDKLISVDKESNIARRRRGDPKLCWRCHKRDATPHMRSCEPCRVADRQRWSRRRNLSKIISGKSGINTNPDSGIGYFNSQLKDDSSISLGSDNLKLDAFHSGYIQSGVQLKCDNQYITGAQDHIRTLSSGISHSNSSIPISSISLAYPFKMDQWRDQQQFTSLRENRTHPCAEISQNLSYITISYFPSSFSGLTTLPVSAKFASDGSMNGLETLPSVVLSFIVDKCNEQLLQRQLVRQNHQNLVSSNPPCNSQVESGLGNILINSSEVNKSIINGTGGLGQFHNFHCTNIHSNTLDSRFYC
ncbi:uncharacterized protein cubi_00601 [Cryptosporidium ubiquitum]|uniref:Uncharacterized protein n=1 Tax=Cryptosporidium ubiquitum TaxID=857276 RepID=A0A1J4MC42_9CRYT|nr:uncharacterized protein cubi_00601 [Cryptosporidium ubiquitum]OII71794.1 hypothetical protein cubi_00601 [Cryptosporidium ubiquitum]